MLVTNSRIKIKIFTLKKHLLYLLFLATFICKGQVIELPLDSMLREAYIAKYPFSEGLTCIPYFCDPFHARQIYKQDTWMCGKFVFVNKNFIVKIKAVFELPCSFEPRFGEGLCAVNIKDEIVFIDTLGREVINTHLAACSPQKNKALPFKNGKSKIYKGSMVAKNFAEIYYINKAGQRLREKVFVKVKLKPILIAGKEDHKNNENEKKKELEKRDTFKLVFDLPAIVVKNRYPIAPTDAAILLKKYPHRNNRMLLYYECGDYQKENMAREDMIYCSKFVFVDTLFNVRINSGFQMPCAFEPEFSEGLAAVGIDSQIVYIDTAGRVKINTHLASCNREMNKASTFKNGIATLYQGDSRYVGSYTTVAINTSGERVRLLEFDELELAEKKIDKFTNLTIEEATDCFVGKGRSNGLWFLIEKSGRVKKKLVLK